MPKRVRNKSVHNIAVLIRKKNVYPSYIFSLFQKWFPNNTLLELKEGNTRKSHFRIDVFMR